MCLYACLIHFEFCFNNLYKSLQKYFVQSEKEKKKTEIPIIL